MHIRRSSPSVLGKLPRGLLHTRPLLLLAEDHAGAVAMEARQITSSAPPRPRRRGFSVPLGTSLLVMERTYFDEAGRPITHSLVQARPDRYEQVISFRRRTDPVGTVRHAGDGA